MSTNKNELNVLTAADMTAAQLELEAETHLNKHYNRGQASTLTVSLETTHANIEI